MGVRKSDQRADMHMCNYAGPCLAMLPRWRYLVMILKGCETHSPRDRGHAAKMLAPCRLLL
eukprot:7253222-Alexandrium_andersonii.AAC.1